MIKTGIDLIMISRVVEKIEKNGDFLNVILTEGEKAYCESKVKTLDDKNKMYQTVAGIYSAKEAFYKALGCGIRSLEYFKIIEVDHDKLGCPYIKIIKTPQNFKELSEIKGCSISISHDGDNAIASCIIEVL